MADFSVGRSVRIGSLTLAIRGKSGDVWTLESDTSTMYLTTPALREMGALVIRSRAWEDGDTVLIYDRVVTYVNDPEESGPTNVFYGLAPIDHTNPAEGAEGYYSVAYINRLLDSGVGNIVKIDVLD